MITEFRGEHSFLSNFAKCPIRYEGILYPTVEHAFQAGKFEDTPTKMQIAGMSNPADAKRFAREAGPHKGFGDKRIPLMRELLRIKFANPAFRDRLLATDNEELVEINHWKDFFWGKCYKNGELIGGNNLGILLMEIRDEIRLANVSSTKEVHGG